MNDVNEKVAEYESKLRDAERAIEAALQAICPLAGAEIGVVRYNLQYKVLPEVQKAIRGTWNLYDNPEVEIAR